MIRLLIADDSPTVRSHLRSVFEAERDFTVVGFADSGDAVPRALEQLAPDVLTLDVHMPGPGAAAVVRSVLETRPLPIVLVTTTPRDDSEVYDALSAGALDFARKPRAGDDAGTRALVSLVRAMSRVEVRRRSTPKATQSNRNAVQLVAVASSTGGPGALRAFLAGLRTPFPVPLVVAQHIARGFDVGLADWLSNGLSLSVEVASSGAALVPGRILLGQAEMDLTVRPGPRVAVQAAPPQGYHPSADTLFSSAAAVTGAGTLAVVLSGIGEDGLVGARAVVAAGGAVLAQSEESCAVYGMPKAVAEARLASYVGAPEDLARHVSSLVAAGARSAVARGGRNRP